jgi:hypothetical protein
MRAMRAMVARRSCEVSHGCGGLPSVPLITNIKCAKLFVEALRSVDTSPSCSLVDCKSSLTYHRLDSIIDAFVRLPSATPAGRPGDRRAAPGSLCLNLLSLFAGGCLFVWATLVIKEVTSRAVIGGITSLLVVPEFSRLPDRVVGPARVAFPAARVLSLPRANRLAGAEDIRRLTTWWRISRSRRSAMWALSCRSRKTSRPCPIGAFWWWPA